MIIVKRASPIALHLTIRHNAFALSGANRWAEVGLRRHAEYAAFLTALWGVAWNHVVARL